MNAHGCDIYVVIVMFRRSPRVSNLEAVMRSEVFYGVVGIDYLSPRPGRQLAIR